MKATTIATLAIASCVSASPVKMCGSAPCQPQPHNGCNPTHDYPGGATCISTQGVYTLYSPIVKTKLIQPTPVPGCGPKEPQCDKSSITPPVTTVIRTTYVPAPTPDCGDKCAPPKPDCGDKCDPPKPDCGDKCEPPKPDCGDKCDSPKRDCMAEMKACRTAPNANQSFCSSKYAECLGYPPNPKPYKPQPSKPVDDCHNDNISDKCKPKPDCDAGKCSDKPVDDCHNDNNCQQKVDCEAQDNACRTAPDANLSSCASQYAGCVGSKTYNNDHNNDNNNDHNNDHNNNHKRDHTDDAAAPPSYPADKDCEAENNACRTAPGVNQAQCSADYASCLGYNPYDDNDDDNDDMDHYDENDGMDDFDDSDPINDGPDDNVPAPECPAPSTVTVTTCPTDAATPPGAGIPPTDAAGMTPPAGGDDGEPSAPGASPPAATNPAGGDDMPGASKPADDASMTDSAGMPGASGPADMPYGADETASAGIPGASSPADGGDMPGASGTADMPPYGADETAPGLPGATESPVPFMGGAGQVVVNGALAMAVAGGVVMFL